MGRYKGSRCIIPKCNSVYDSNTEKCHRFSVPFKEEVLLKWAKAIPRKDFVNYLFRYGREYRRW